MKTKRKTRMPRSRIGYEGVGADGEPIEWYYGWNPGGFGCSMRCDGCWSMTIAKRLAAQASPFCRDCADFKVHLHHERLDQPANTKKPGVVLVNFTCDIADRHRSDAELERMWDVMWRCPQHQFVVLTKQHKRLARWIAAHASGRGFGWTDWERRPIDCGDYRHMDDIRMRNECGYVGDDDDHDWCCLHPENDERGQSNSCDCWTCPLAVQVDTQAQLREIGIEGQYEFDENGMAKGCECEWMQWIRRPPNAAASNVWVGFTARNQAELRSAVAAIALIKGCNPHAHAWLSLEPLQSLLDFQMERYLTLKPEPGETPTMCNWLKEKIELQHGSDVHCLPYIDGVIVGHDNSRGALGAGHWNHVRSVVMKCQAAGVPVFVKQLWASLCQHCGRHPRNWHDNDRLDRCGECGGDVVLPARRTLCTKSDQFPPDLRLRQLPWSRPKGPRE